MEVDVLYRVQEDSCWQHINKYVRPASINLAVYHTCPDIYIVKKTIWNVIGRLSSGGIFVIHTCPRLISHIIPIIENQNLNYEIFYLCVNNNIDPLVIVYKNNFNIHTGSRLITVNDYFEYGDRIIRLCNYGDTLLFVGDQILPLAVAAKKLAMNDDVSNDIIEEKDEQELDEALEEMEEVKATASEVVVKPKDIEEYDKANAKEISEEEQKKIIEENIVGEFDE
jgi:hypothetical protein